MWIFCDDFVETSFSEGEFEGREFAREKLEDFECGWGWEEDGVDAVDYAVCAELWRNWLAEGRRQMG